MIAIAGRRKQGISAHNVVCQVLFSVYANEDVPVCCPASQNQPLHPLPLCATFRGCYFPEFLPEALCLTEQLTWQVLFNFVLCLSLTGDGDVSGLPGTARGSLGVSVTVPVRSVTVISTSQTSHLQADLSWRVDGLFQKGAAEFCSNLMKPILGHVPYGIQIGETATRAQ